MNMYWHELKSLRKSTIIWILSLIALAGIYFAVYPGIAADASDFKKLLGGYPPTVRAMLGISLDNITSILGFYSMVLSFITLCAAIQASNLGISVISKETRGRTADFLLVKPVSRASIVSAKLLASLTVLLITDGVYYAAVWAMASIVKTGDYSGSVFFMMNATILFVQLIFFAIGLLASVIIPKLKSVLPVSLGLVFIFFFIGTLLVTGKDDAVRFLSPFKYFDLSYILSHSAYEFPYLMAGLAIVLAAIGASYVIYVRKDIHAAS